MFVLMNNEIRSRLFRAFPEAFINGNLEYIACPRQNSYFRLEDIEDERDLKAKILEWLSGKHTRRVIRIPRGII